MYTDCLIGFGEKPTEKPSEKCSISVSVLLGLKPAETVRFGGGETKNDRAILPFRFTTLHTTANKYVVYLFA